MGDDTSRTVVAADIQKGEYLFINDQKRLIWDRDDRVDSIGYLRFILSAIPGEQIEFKFFLPTQLFDEIEQHIYTFAKTKGFMNPQEEHGANTDSH